MWMWVARRGGSNYCSGGNRKALVVVLLMLVAHCQGHAELPGWIIYLFVPSLSPLQ